jgi:GNAT superfamily N-acetyltransferase
MPCFYASVSRNPFKSESVMPLSLRRATPADAVAIGEICYDAFRTIAQRHNFPPDFAAVDGAVGLAQHMTGAADVFGVIAELDGRIVGSNFLWESGGVVAGVGPITIKPLVQNESIGRRLMEAVLERARSQRFSSVRLVQAAYHGRSMALYTKLGFVVREPLVVMQGGPLDVRIEGHDVRAMTAADVEAANGLCVRVHGHDRSGDLRGSLLQGTATVVQRAGRITGYATGTGFFGHAVGETTDDLKALIASARTYAGPGFLLPTRNAELFRWCLENGLRIVQPMTLMSTGLYNEPAGAFLPSILL